MKFFQKKRLKIRRGLIGNMLIILIGTGPVSAQGNAAGKHADEAYWQVVSKRAEKIVAGLAISDDAKAGRVCNLIAQQYYDLNGIHDTCKVEQARLKSGITDQKEAERKIRQLQEKADKDLDKLHGRFIKKLSKELNPEQIEGVKNGMTYGVLPITYAGYLDMIPELKEEEKQQIRDWLVEAREYAMDAGSSEEKHGWFGKYKGRINNYLSSRGYDLKKYSKAREARIRESQK